MSKFCIKCGNKLKLKTIDDREQFACTAQSCDYVLWDNPVPVVTAIIEYENDIILVRNSGWPEKMYGLVSGFLEKGETPEEGIIREIKEEIGLDGEIQEFLGVYSFFQMNQILIAYHISAKGDIKTNEEIAEIKKISVEKVRPWAVGTGVIVKDWLEKRKEGFK
jgi:NADH pyrophosphatase NudC (nudix superfamily)